jgi:hypothetical protein
MTRDASGGGFQTTSPADPPGTGGFPELDA